MKHRTMRDAYKDTTKTSLEHSDDVAGGNEIIWHEDEMQCCNEGPKDGVVVNKPISKSKYRKFN